MSGTFESAGPGDYMVVFERGRWWRKIGGVNELITPRGHTEAVGMLWKPPRTNATLYEAYRQHGCPLCLQILREVAEREAA